MTQSQQQNGIGGVVPIMPIPFDELENLDESALRRLVDFAATAGVSAICLPAYGSEFYKLSDEERARVVQIAVEQTAGRMLVIAQSNHGSARETISLARANIRAGADLVSLTVPRLFVLPEDDLLCYLSQVINAVDVPCLVQDYNPSGPSVSPEFVARLHAACPNFQYLKLEEPLMAPKVKAIREATNDEVGVLEGWCGLYVMELVPAGICGLMPGLALADILNRVFHLRKSGRSAEAFELFERVLPQIVFCVQNMEVFLYCEKRLLKTRGLLANARCRSAAYTPDPLTERYVDELNERILEVIHEAGTAELVARNWSEQPN